MPSPVAEFAAAVTFSSPRLDACKAAVALRIALGQHVLLWGPPSGGKSWLADAVVEEGRFSQVFEADLSRDTDSSIISSTAITNGSSHAEKGPMWLFAEAMAGSTARGERPLLRIREVQHLTEGAGLRALTHVTDRTTRRFPLPNGSHIVWQEGSGAVLAEANGRPLPPQLVDRFSNVYLRAPDAIELASYLRFLGLDPRTSTAIGGIVATRNEQITRGTTTGFPTSFRALRRLVDLHRSGLSLLDAALAEVIPDAQERREDGDEVPEADALLAALGPRK